MRLILPLLCALLLGCAGLACAPAFASDPAPMIPTEWLQKKISVTEAEAEYRGITGDRAKRFPDAAKAFGFRHREWEELKALMLPGDQIWTFRSPPNTWQDLAGRAGVALLRNGVPIRIIVTVMN